MDTHALRLFGVRGLTAVAIAAGLAALMLLAASVENSALFSRWQPWILLLTILGVMALMVLLTRKLWQLYRDYRDHAPGSRLTVRTVVMFGSLVIAPLLIVYLFSLACASRRAAPRAWRARCASCTDRNYCSGWTRSGGRSRPAKSSSMTPPGALPRSAAIRRWCSSPRRCRPM